MSVADAWVDAGMAREFDPSEYGRNVAEIYDEVYENLDPHAAVECIAGYAEGRAVLELGIGTGRLALPLAARGLEVHGIDSSPAMVARMRAKPGGANVPVVIGDFAEVATLVDRRYPLVYLAFNSLFELGSQDEQLHCIQGVADRLVEGGVFVVEAIAPDLSNPGDVISAVSIGEDTVRIQVTRHDALAQVVTGQTVTFSDAGAELWPWSIRYATVAEIDLMARVAGLRLRQRAGGWSGEEFDERSFRHVSVYERSGRR